MTPRLDHYRATFDAAARAGVIAQELAERLKPSVGMRNVLVHEYVNVDLTIVAAAAPMARTIYGDDVRGVAAWLASIQLG